MIAASQLYDFVHCPHRVALDEYGNPELRDEPNAFVELLWEHGIRHEERIVESLGITANLRRVPFDEREQATLAAMSRREPLIFGGRLTTDEKVGEPDLLKIDANGCYLPGDIKSGGGFDGDADVGKYKKHYVFQLAHYVDILNEKGLGSGATEGFIIDGSGTSVVYDLSVSAGVKNTQTWWERYLDASQNVRAIVNKELETRPALASPCKLCHWQSHCKSELVASNDLTLIAELGRSKRDTMSCWRG
jgi:predicted RecB family nuclease